jgi:hypothetical protein
MMHSILGSFDITVTAVGLEEEIKCLQKEKDQLNQERARMLENERKAGEEVKARNRELTGKTSFAAASVNSFVFIARY